MFEIAAGWDGARSQMYARLMGALSAQDGGRPGILISVSAVIWGGCLPSRMAQMMSGARKAQFSVRPSPAECYRSRQSLVIWGMSAYKPPAPQRMAAIYPADSLALLALPP